MNKILIVGFPHSGTTILRELIGRHTDIFSFKTHEYKKVPSEYNNKKIPCVKWPYFEEEFLTNKYIEYLKIFIIRDPRFSLSSIFTRFGNLNRNKHTIKDWDRTAKKFLELRDAKDWICIRYEDLFDNNIKIFEEVFNKLEIPYQDIKNIELEAVTNEDIPDAITQHKEFRFWQVKQKLKNHNQPHKITLTDNYIKIIADLKTYNVIYKTFS